MKTLAPSCVLSWEPGAKRDTIRPEGPRSWERRPAREGNLGEGGDRVAGNDGALFSAYRILRRRIYGMLLKSTTPNMHPVANVTYGHLFFTD